jgi:phosphate/sulfate permease
MLQGMPQGPLERAQLLVARVLDMAAMAGAPATVVTVMVGAVAGVGAPAGVGALAGDGGP